MIPNKISAILIPFHRFLSFVFKNFPIAYYALIIITLGIFLEYLALSLMIPLSGNSGQGLSLKVAEAWRQFAVDMGIPDEPRNWLWLFLFIFGLRILVGLIQIALNAKVSKLIHFKLSFSTFSRVISDVAMQDIYRHSVGHYMALAGDDSIRVGQLFFSFLQIFSALSSAAIGLFALYLYDANVFIIITGFLLITGIVLSSFMRKILSLSSTSRALSKEAVSVFVETLNGLRSIRSMTAETYVNLRYKKSLFDYTKTLFAIDLYNHSLRILPGLLLILIALVLLFPRAAIASDVSVIYFFTLVTIIIRILSFLGVAVFSAGRIVADIGAIYDLDQIINLPKSSYKKNNKTIITEVKEINLSNLTCGYAVGKNIIEKIDGQFKAGERYAVIGGSGSGKSTLSDLLLGLLNPVSGSISIASINYKNIDLISLRRKVVLVEQQTRIFSGSIRENIEFGLHSTDAEVWMAIQIAGLEEFLHDLANGLDTQLEYQGANISGGQRQRIGLARAILRKPDVLILDEATSALDTQTRDLVLDSLYDQFKEKILIFITHDLNISKSVGEVWNLNGGTLSIQKRNYDGTTT